VAGQGRHALARGRGPARRVLADPHQRPPGRAGPHHKNGKRRRRGSLLPPETGPLPGITVRVIAFTVTVTGDDGKTRTERYRLLTTLTGWHAHPGAGLAGCYAWRWAIETGYRECKTYLRGPGRRLRGRTPDLARQELWAYLAVYQAIRVIIVRAAAGAGIDPDRISFTAALHAIRRTLPAARDHMPAALAGVEAEILTSLVPERHGRIYPRAVTKPISPYPSRRVRPGPVAQHAQYTITTTPPATPALTRPDNPNTDQIIRLKFPALVLVSPVVHDPRRSEPIPPLRGLLDS
jgi:hypothetical protein